MLNFITDVAQIFLSRLDKSHTTNEKVNIMRCMIVAEAKHNNDIATIIVNNGAKNVAVKSPKLYDAFSIESSNILVALGWTAQTIFGEINIPLDEPDRTTIKRKFLDEKHPSQLYEFYIRKCLALKKLYHAEALLLEKLKLPLRCGNVKYATMLLASRLST